MIDDMLCLYEAVGINIVVNDPLDKGIIGAVGGFA